MPRTYGTRQDGGWCGVPRVPWVPWVHHRCGTAGVPRGTWGRAHQGPPPPMVHAKVLARNVSSHSTRMRACCVPQRRCSPRAKPEPGSTYARRYSLFTRALTRARSSLSAREPADSGTGHVRRGRRLGMVTARPRSGRAYVPARQRVVTRAHSARAPPRVSLFTWPHHGHVRGYEEPGLVPGQSPGTLRVVRARYPPRYARRVPQHATCVTLLERASSQRTHGAGRIVRSLGAASGGDVWFRVRVVAGRHGRPAS